MVEGRASELDFIQLPFFHGDIRDSRKYDTFRGKQAVLFINLLGKGLTQEINGDEAPFDGFLLLRWAPAFTIFQTEEYPFSTKWLPRDHHAVVLRPEFCISRLKYTVKRQKIERESSKESSVFFL